MSFNPKQKLSQTRSRYKSFTSNQKFNLEEESKVQLTSLLDVLTILLIFLMKSFSLNPQITNLEPNIQVPIAQPKAQIKNELILSISKTQVIFNGNTIFTLPIHSNNEEEILQKLDLALAKSFSRSKSLIIQADQSLPFGQIKKILSACQNSSFKNISILVLQ